MGRQKKKLVAELCLKDGYPSDHIRQHHYTRPLLHHCSALRISCGKAGGAWDRTEFPEKHSSELLVEQAFSDPPGGAFKDPGGPLPPNQVI